MVLCRYFLKGHCTNGDVCTFEHGAITTPKIQPCPFFQKGTCRFGTSCKNVHDPGANETSNQPPVDRRSTVPCTFFLRNACTEGARCAFSHASDFPVSIGTRTEVADKQQQDEAAPSHADGIDHSTDSHLSPRTIGGASVAFGDGVAVSGVWLPSDYSTLALSDLPVTLGEDDIRNILERWTDVEAVESIVLRLDQLSSTKSAEIKVADRGRARKAVLKDGSSVKAHGSSITVRTVQVAQSGSGMNRLQLSTVSCSWHEPSTTAVLKYATASHANQALAQAKDTRELHGRRIAMSRAYYSSALSVLNLDTRTTIQDLKRHLHRPAPLEIQLGKSSHLLSATELSNHVKTLLEEYGDLVEWSITTKPGSANVKARATFANPQAASQARALEGKILDPRSNDKLHVDHIVSVKLPVSQRILDMTRSQLQRLAEASQSTRSVMIKVYDNPLKPYTQVRVSGSRKDSVAHVKEQVENLLAGRIACHDTQPLTEPFFFQNTALSFFKKIMDDHEVLVIPDNGKRVLRIWGEAQNVDAAQTALVRKTVELDLAPNAIALSPKAFTAAMRGGLQRLKSVLGEDKVKLDITSHHRQILVIGNHEEVAKARELLHSQHKLSDAFANLSTGGDEELQCSVCFTAAEDPFTTSCGHLYCKQCLVSQAACMLVFPVRCLGSSGDCDKPLTLQDLRRVLTSSDYDTLFTASLTKHVRTHPTEFQYCPTPDCDRFYRISIPDDAMVFDCDHCLSSICTACHRSPHEGQTCNEAKEGTEGFTKWKEENDVRDCPTCSMPIEKTMGCNHMTCGACGAHMCWQCMKVFKTGPEVYGHMTKEHNQNWGL